MEFLEEINEPINSILDPLFTQSGYTRLVLMLFLAVYGGLAKPPFPPQLASLVNSYPFRVLMLALLVWIANKDPGVAIVSSMALIAVFNAASGKGLFETFEGPTNAIYPGCMNITVFDLLESFKNDKTALLNAMLVARVPGDVKLTDYYAPLIATYLLNKGFILKAPCTPPGVSQTMGVSS